MYEVSVGDIESGFRAEAPAVVTDVSRQSLRSLILPTFRRPLIQMHLESLLINLPRHTPIRMETANRPHLTQASSIRLTSKLSFSVHILALSLPCR